MRRGAALVGLTAAALFGGAAALAPVPSSATLGSRGSLGKGLGRRDAPDVAGAFAERMRVGGPSSQQMRSLVSTRGGAVKGSGGKKKKETLIITPNRPARKSALKWAKEKFAGIPLATRMYLSLVLVVTALSMTFIDPAFLVVDLPRTLLRGQVWRPFTAAAFLGPPSMSWLSNMYHLVQYGQSLEQTEGSAQQLIFLLFQVMVLSLIHGILGMPVTATALSSANLHCCGRLDPEQEVNWLLGIRVKFWMLPACFAVTDVLSTQSPMAALPHVTGVLAGHLYFFMTHIWPKLGGREWLVPPKSWVKRLNAGGGNDILSKIKARRRELAAEKKGAIKVKPKKGSKVKSRS